MIRVVHGITILEEELIKRELGISTENPFSCNQERPRITSRCPISKTSASKTNFVGFEILFCIHDVTNEALTTYLPPFTFDLSACRTFTFLALLYMPIRLAISFPTIGAVAAVSTTAWTVVPAILIGTVSKAECLGVRPTESAPPILFPNPLHHWFQILIQLCELTLHHVQAEFSLQN